MWACKQRMTGAGSPPARTKSSDLIPDDTPFPTSIVAEPLYLSVSSTPHHLPKPSDSYLADDSPLRRQIITQYYALLGVKGERKTARGRESNPAPNPCSFTHRGLSELAQHPEELIVTPKSDGVRYQLFLGQYSNGSPFSVMLDRRMFVYPVTVMAEDAYFQSFGGQHHTSGTLLDGELVLQSEPGGESFLCWWAFDIYAFKGRQLREYPYEHRLRFLQRTLPPAIEVLGNSPRQIRETLEALVKQSGVIGLVGPLDPAPHLRAKPFWPLLQHTSEKALRETERLGHRLDGWIFSQSNAHVVPGAQNLQWKFKLRHTVDLELRGCWRTATANQPVLGLFYVVADHTCPHADLVTRWETEGKCVYRNGCTANGSLQLDHGQNITFALVLNDRLESILATQHQRAKEFPFRFSVLVECECRFASDTQLLCSVLHVRSDKTEPNNRTCLKRTLESVREQMSEEEMWKVLLTKVTAAH